MYVHLNRICVCDRFERYEALREEMKGTSTNFLLPAYAHAKNPPLSIDVPSIQVLKDGHQVSRISDFIIYSVEAEFISQVVSTYGPCKHHIKVRERLKLT